MATINSLDKSQVDTPSSPGANSKCFLSQFTDRCNFSEPLDDVSQDPIGSINALQLINVSEGDRNRMLASVAVQTEGLSLVVVAYTRVGDLSSDSTVAMVCVQINLSYPNSFVLRVLYCVRISG